MSTHSTIPTDIATLPRAISPGAASPCAPISSTADETDHDDLDRSIPIDASMPSPPPTASNDVSDLSHRVHFLSGKVNSLADTVGRLSIMIEGSVLSFFTFVKELDTKFEGKFDEVDHRLDSGFDGVHDRFGRVDDLLGRLFLTVGSLDGKIDPLGGRSDFFEAGVGQRFEHSDLSRDTWLARIEQEVSGVKLSVGCCWAAKGAEARERLMARWLVSVSEI